MSILLFPHTTAIFRGALLCAYERKDMHPKDLPRIQGRRFDIETLQFEALSLVKQAQRGPTWIRHGGRIAYVVMTEELFDQFWPDPQRALSLDDMPLRYEELLMQGIEDYWKRRSDQTSD